MRQMRRSSRARAPAALGSARGSLLDRGCLPFTSPFLCFLRWAPGCSAKHPSKVAVVRSNSPKLLRANVIVIDARIVEHSPQTFRHRRRSGHVVDGHCDGGFRKTIQVTGEHFRIDVPGRASALSLRAAHGCHCRYKSEVDILLLDGTQLLQEQCIFRVPVCVKEEEFMWQPFVRGVANHAAKRGDTNSAGQQDSGTAHIVMEREVAERPVYFRNTSNLRLL